MNMPNRNLGPECSHFSTNEIFDMMFNKTIDDEDCHVFVIGLAIEHEEEMTNKGYVFDPVERIWKKEGWPDTAISIPYHYMMRINQTGFENHD